MDIDETRVKYAKHNAKVYEVEEKVDFVHSDFFDIKGIRPDIVFLAPPWGGIEYSNEDNYSPLKCIRPDIKNILEHSLTLSANLAMLLPKNSKVSDFAELFDEILTKMKS